MGHFPSIDSLFGVGGRGAWNAFVLVEFYQLSSLTALGTAGQRGIRGSFALCFLPRVPKALQGHSLGKGEEQSSAGSLKTRGRGSGRLA